MDVKASPSGSILRHWLLRRAGSRSARSGHAALRLATWSARTHTPISPPGVCVRGCRRAASFVVEGAVVQPKIERPSRGDGRQQQTQQSKLCGVTVVVTVARRRERVGGERVGGAGYGGGTDEH
eukprot:scaffold14199_cov74-Phaeocystis_antarctica.AAC.1